MYMCELIHVFTEYYIGDVYIFICTNSCMYKQSIIVIRTEHYMYCRKVMYIYTCHEESVYVYPEYYTRDVNIYVYLRSNPCIHRVLYA